MIRTYFKECLEDTALSKTAYENAKEKYEAIGEYLEDYFSEKYGIELTIYPQGSFSTGTVVRPYTDGENRMYDVDVIVEVDTSKKKYTSSELKSMIKAALDSTSRYKEKYTEWDKCFTIEFANIGNYEFTIDVIPSVPEDAVIKNQLIPITEITQSLESAIAIPATMSNKRENDWITNNPKGYSRWFNSQKETYILEHFNLQHRLIYNSVDDLPDGADTTQLQDVVKAMKRLMDVYYDKKGYSNKPASIIISTVAAKLSIGSYQFDEFELLKYIIEQLQSTSNYATFTNSSENTNAISKIIRRQGGEWVMKNPCNGKDNLLDAWNQDSSAAERFREWLKYLQEIVLPALKVDTPNNYKIIKEAFAASVALPELEPPKNTLNTKMQTKSWRKYGHGNY